ncbi:DUF4189 domain-containing protein [Xanthomonas floridensis]|uniref:DUF4189 domain-containing protein n=1 Tax=Xanthomonas floridensis TaxID=1843580 RepID=A0ABU5PY90_9XANT|nr:DUF4189 domain-containing protein [Xanthomonas floridensis]MEA5124575.1 DUF4189 domain-containing protein [Xanthomonas floridensis]MEA5132170.1 DUF4189 domain-containing protein [Xanthomonas floridensis]
MKLIKYFSYLAMLLPFHAMGEGRCPPGFVPIGGQGAEGCAPIGGSSTSMPQPTGHWEKRWGAIALEDGEGGAVGVSAGKKSRRDAVGEAVNLCEKTGVSCKTFVYFNQCAALAWPGRPEHGRIIRQGAEKLQQAESLALEKCNNGGDNDCKIVYSACSYPEFRRY